MEDYSVMEKLQPGFDRPAPLPRTKGCRRGVKLAGLAALALVTTALYRDIASFSYRRLHRHYYERLAGTCAAASPYGQFPVPDDPFRFIPCTNATRPPALDDSNPERSWAHLFDLDPEHWSWGRVPTGDAVPNGDGDKYSGRGIYMCGYLDVPLDYTNQSESRIARLAVTKFQVSGLAPVGLPTGVHANPHPGSKSKRTIVIEPGGPGGSGTSYTWRAAEDVTTRLSGGQFDVLGWDPRGVNASLPSVSCYPADAYRDRWSLLTGEYREVSASPRAQLELADAMNEALFRACWERQGDLGRFVGTAFVARDMEEIRKALGEDELTGYLVSYGTGIGQTYANMFPDSVGRMILDGTEYVRDHRLLGGFGWTALDNVTNAWHDGFLGECINAGPEYCALSRSRDGNVVTLEILESRMDTLMKSLIRRPIPGYLTASGPSLVTYSSLVGAIYSALYNAQSWPAAAQMLYDLEDGNSTLAIEMLDKAEWQYNPASTPPPFPQVSSDELGSLVICADSYDALQPADGLVWWESLWANMTSQSWIAGNSRFFSVFPCRQFARYWPEPAEVYRGDLNHTLRHPILLIAETYDPATPLRNGRRLLAEMGTNARLIAHHGYGHSSRDKSSCTDKIAKAYILEGKLPTEQETACYADGKPYLYKANATGTSSREIDPVAIWKEHIQEIAYLKPELLLH
ncbi:putative peptidase tripeptidyl-peptidase [Rosellinia necatrix]|uniref:Putative peptidase tripeptidyl-peptidase n=1 Tax=Rosellinia necatrix TaxID=77044 RepID=A0A1W2THB8_ROSNE|nr:putative peptidase tripeptidyl-peptidase [Rosellinia necatrix]